MLGVTSEWDDEERGCGRQNGPFHALAILSLVIGVLSISNLNQQKRPTCAGGNWWTVLV